MGSNNRAPRSSKNKLIPAMFFEDFETLLELIIPIPEQILIIGDLNWHVDDINDSAACRFLGLLEAAGLQQHVDKPTYDSNHTLALVMIDMYPIVK